MVLWERFSVLFASKFKLLRLLSFFSLQNQCQSRSYLLFHIFFVFIIHDNVLSYMIVIIPSRLMLALKIRSNNVTSIVRNILSGDFWEINAFKFLLVFFSFFIGFFVLFINIFDFLSINLDGRKIIIGLRLWIYPLRI